MSQCLLRTTTHSLIQAVNTVLVLHNNIELEHLLQLMNSKYTKVEITSISKSLYQCVLKYVLKYKYLIYFSL
jgi:hypothetical protein